MSLVRMFVGILSPIFLAGLSGCNASIAPEQSNLKPLAVLYGQYVSTHRGVPPASEEEFKNFIRESRTEFLAAQKIDNLDRLFISPRDNQPYVIAYGQAAGAMGPSAMPAFGPGAPGATPPPGGASGSIVVYEALGVNGKRFVVNSLGAVQLVSEEKFRELVPNAK